MEVQENGNGFEGTRAEVKVKTQRTLLRYELEDFLAAKAQISIHTRRSYHQKISKFIRWLELETEVEELEDLTRDHIRAFLDHLSSGHSPGGVHFYFRTIRVWVKWAQREYEFPDWDPFRNVQAPRLIQNPYPAAPIEDIRKLLKACDRRTRTGMRNDALIRFLLDTGVRASEVVRLRVHDVDIRTGDVRLPAASTKSKKARIVFLGAAALRSLRRFLNRRGAVDSESLFGLQYFGICSALNALAETAGLGGHVTCHMIRKSYATESHRHGEDLETLRRKLGHSSLLVTQRYLGLNEDDLRRAHKEHSPGDRLL